MLKLLQAESAHLRSLSPSQLEFRVKLITAIAIIFGYLVQGAHGVALACMALCFIGFSLQYVKRRASPDSLVHSITNNTPFSFNGYFLSTVVLSLLLTLYKRNIEFCMGDMAMWALLLCLISSVVKFSPKEWRYLAIGAAIISAGYIGSIGYDALSQFSLNMNPSSMRSAVPIMFSTYALNVLALITLALVGVGRLSRRWSQSGLDIVGAASQSFTQKLRCFFQRAIRQCVAEMPVYVFLVWYAGVVFCLSFPPGSIGEMFSNQFLHSAYDANLYPYREDQIYSKHSRLLAPEFALRDTTIPVSDLEELGKVSAPPPIAADPFADGVDNPPARDKAANDESGSETTSVWVPTIGNHIPTPAEKVYLREGAIAAVLVQCVVAFGFFALPFGLIMRAAAFYAALMRRLIGSNGKLRMSESLLSAVRDTGDKLRLKYENRFFAHAATTFWWLLFWYAVVFSLVAFTGGFIGAAIRSWIDFSIVDSGLRHVSTEYNLNMRYFMAAVLAMYASAPLAVTGCVFLPHKSGRKVVVSEDGISVPDGPFVSMWLRTFRLYVDVKSVMLHGKSVPEPEYSKDKRRVKIQFRTGGFLSFRVMDMPPEDLRLLLERIDEHAEDCKLSPEIVDLRLKLSKESEAKSATEGSVRRGKFKSSIFVPFVGGERIESHDLRIVKVLANKPLSAVYLVRLNTGKLAVLKQLVMPKDDESSRDHLRIFQRECEVMRELHHDGIAHVIDAFSEKNNHFLLLEHFKGQDLKTMVDTYGSRNIEDVATWALDICDVLEYSHSKEIIHRDVTPENIVVGEHHGVRLIDFGAAHQFIEGITGTLIGKQSYVAPEQLRGKATKRSDIYSLGVTMNFLLTAKEPIALMQCEPDLGVGPNAHLMRNLIKAMTDFEEERRPQTIQEVRRVLLSVLNRNSETISISIAEAVKAVVEKPSAAPVSETVAEIKETVSETAAEDMTGTSDSQARSDSPDQKEEEAVLAMRTIQLMADALPEQTLKVKTKQRKKVKVNRQVNPEN